MATIESSAAPAASYIELSTKPGAKIAYTFIPYKGTSDTGVPLLVFLNGLGLPAASWMPTISLLRELPSHPPILTYDRYGQGLTTEKDPQDAQAADPEHPHDCLDVVQDLHQLITQLSSVHNLDQFVSHGGIFLVGNSIGGALARLYAEMYPKTASALLLLDSVLANSDFVSIFPDPDASNFAETHTPLPEGITEEDIRKARAICTRIFHPSNGVLGKAEGLSRKTLPELLPEADAPVLMGVGRKTPLVTVVGHGFKVFADEALKVS